MRKVWVIARHEYLVNLRRPGFLIMTAIVPLLGAVVLLIGAFFAGEASAFFERHFVTTPTNIGIVDHSGAFTPILPAYRDRFRAYPTEEAARQALQADEITTLLVIPEDYLETGRVLVFSKAGSFSATVLEDSKSIRAFFVDHLLRGKVDATLRQRVSDPLKPVLMSPEGKAQPQSNPLSVAFNFILPFALSILLVMTIFVSSGYLLRGVAEEKTSRVIEIILSSVTARELLAGKVLGLGALGLTQVMVWILSAFALSGGAAGLLGVVIPLLTRPEVFILGVVYYLFGFLVYAVLMGAVGSLGTTMQESQQLAGLFSLTAFLPMMLSGFIFSNPNMTLARAFSWFPLTAPTMMLLRLPMVEVPLSDIVGSIGMLILTIPAVLWAGGKVFRMGLLMYGKRPGVRQVWRALREA